MQYINCGCGEKYIVSDEWINIDFVTKGSDVIAHNILKGLPFENNYADALFTSCMLEHFNRSEGENFVKECFRVIKPGGIIRIVVPDLENWANEYIKVLGNVRKDEETFKSKYEYLMIELIDQMTRTVPGGYMKEYWLDEKCDENYILERTGYPAGWKKTQLSVSDSEEKNYIKNALRLLLRKIPAYNYYRIGKFVLSGEQHKWMYDSYSLGKMMSDNGFENVRIRKYNESDIPRWVEYGLEVGDNGNEYKPNNLYIEAVKPSV